MKCGSSRGKELRGMIRTLVVTRPPILDHSHDAGKTAAGATSDETVMGAVRAFID